MWSYNSLKREQTKLESHVAGEMKGPCVDPNSLHHPKRLDGPFRTKTSACKTVDEKVFFDHEWQPQKLITDEAWFDTPSTISEKDLKLQNKIALYMYFAHSNEVINITKLVWDKLIKDRTWLITSPFFCITLMTK